MVTLDPEEEPVHLVPEDHLEFPVCPDQKDIVDSLADPDLREIKENLVIGVNSVLLAHQVHQVQWDHEACLENVEEMVRPARRVCAVLTGSQVLPVLLAPLVPLDLLASLEFLALKETEAQEAAKAALVSRVLGENQVPLDPLERPEDTDLRVSMVFQEKRDQGENTDHQERQDSQDLGVSPARLDLQDLQVLRELGEILEPRDTQEKQDPREQMDPQEREENQVCLEKPENVENEEHPEYLDQLDLVESVVYQEREGCQVKMVPQALKVPLEVAVNPEHRETRARPEIRVDLVPLVCKA